MAHTENIHIGKKSSLKNSEKIDDEIRVVENEERKKNRERVREQTRVSGVWCV